MFWPNSICKYLHKCFASLLTYSKVFFTRRSKNYPLPAFKLTKSFVLYAVYKQNGCMSKDNIMKSYSWRMFSFYILKYPCQIRSQHCYWCPVSLYCKVIIKHGIDCMKRVVVWQRWIFVKQIKHHCVCNTTLFFYDKQSFSISLVLFSFITDR